MRLALFVEGSVSSSAPSLADVWQGICAELGVIAPGQVHPISKRHLVAMDATKPKMSGAGEGLDDLIQRMHKRDPFEAAIVLWDLHPAWSPDAEACRWRETVALYEHMSVRAKLPEPFLGWARRRHRELTQRTTPKACHAPVRLVPGAVLPVCMVPELESWFIQDEVALRDVLGLTHQQSRKWPDFSNASSLRPKEKLAQAIAAVQAIQPLPEVCRKVRRDWRTNQYGWTRYLSRELSRRYPTVWRAHAIALRLREVLPAVQVPGS